MPNFCKKCGSEPIVRKMPKTSIHYAKSVCPKCNSFIDWIKKPTNEFKRGKQKYTPENLGIEICELCGRNREKLGNRETLAVHHKHPREEGGLDEKNNTLVLCTPCHALFHFMRKYLHHHLNDFYNGTR